MSTPLPRYPRRALALPSLLAAALALAPRRAAAMTCSFTGVSGVSFGAYNIFSSTPLDSTGSITYLCETGMAAFVTIDISAGSSGVYSTRTLQNGTATLDYNLYLSATRTGAPWGDGAGATDHYGPVLVELGTPATVTIYGRIPALQNAAAGSYTDTVVVTINF